MRKLLLNLFLSTVGLLFAGQASAQEEIAPGIIKLQAGEIDTFTPYSLFGGKPAVEAMKQLPAAKPPFSPDEVQIKITDRGCLIEVLWRTTNKYTVSDFNSKLSVSVACASAR